jgi:SNF2 family DNA or RNA helicase
MSFNVENYNWPAFQGRKPFLHQKHTVKFVLENRNCFVLNEMGTGKTLSVLWALDILFTAKRIRKVLVVCPLSTMKIVWLNELFMNMPHRRGGIAHGVKQLRIGVLQDPSCEIVIINHDGIKVIEDEIIRERPDLIVIDEVTAFKSNSERTKCMRRITDTGRRSRWLKGVWSLTGDLTPESPVDAFYPCKITVPHNQFLPTYYGQFFDACMSKINEYVNLPKPEAPQIVAMCTQPAIRFTRDQCLDLPETTYQLMDVPLSAEQQHYYEVMRREALIESESGTIKAVNAAVKLNKLLQISAGAVKNTDGTVIELDCDERLKALYEIYEQTPQRKLVVFATYRATIAQLLAFFMKKGVRAAAIHGDVHQNLRAEYIDQFQNRDLQVLILQPQSSAHGITLTAASTIVWYSLIASNELYQQGNARIVRPGQTRKTLILVFASTKAERHIAGILQRKGDVSEEILKLFIDREI